MYLGCFKKEAYEKLLCNIPNNVKRYTSSEDWLPDYFSTMPDFFETSSIEVDKFAPEYTREAIDDAQKSDEDLVNSRLIHKAFRTLSPYQASNKYMWAFLCHKPEYRSYILARWMQDDIENTIRLRFFANSSRDRLNFNALSRLWWCAHLTYEPQNPDPYELTEILFTNQGVFTDVMYTLNIMNPNRMKGVLLAIRDFKKELAPNEGIKDYFRECKKYLNHYAAVTVLEFLEATEIRDLAYNYMIRLRDEKHKQ